MWDILREATIGELLNNLSGGRILPYPDQRPDYVIPEKYLATAPMSTDTTMVREGKPSQDAGSLRMSTSEKPGDELKGDDGDAPSTRVGSAYIPPEEADASASKWNSDAPTRIASSDRIVPPAKGEKTDKALEAGNVDEEMAARDVEGHPEELDKALENAKAELGNYILVDWDGEDDPENPRNWSFGKRNFVLFQICLLTFSVYIGSAIYTASIPYVTQAFGVANVTAELGLSLFIFGYAVGPMLLSPLQELPVLGRNPAYIITLAIFALLQIPTALAPNIGSLLVLRFLSGFFGSPALATGGASVGDIYPPQWIAFPLGLWAMAAVCGPVLGPIVGGFAAAANGWRWPLWELAWVSGFSAIFLAILLPETLPGTILLKRAKRLRKLTGNPRLRSMSEIEQAHMTPRAIAAEYLIRPFQLMLEPAILFINIYIGLAYAVFYLWFESFPLVFTDIYGFKGGIAGLPFLALAVGAIVSYIGYCAYNIFYLGPRFQKLNFNVPPEEFLRLSCFAGIFIPISLLMFGWSARPSVHWIVPMIGAGLYIPGIYLLFQSAIVYLPITYPKYAASIFAGNDLFRSAIAGAFPLFGKAFFDALGLGGGSSLLAGVSLLMIPCMWMLFLYGHRLRAMSKYTEH